MANNRADSEIAPWLSPDDIEGIQSGAGFSPGAGRRERTPKPRDRSRDEEQWWVKEGFAPFAYKGDADNPVKKEYRIGKNNKIYVKPIAAGGWFQLDEVGDDWSAIPNVRY